MTLLYKPYAIRKVFLTMPSLIRISLAVGLALACVRLAASTAAAVDMDGDGLGDFWQLLYRGGGLQAGGDEDRDGASNLEESAAGTDPFDAASVFKITAVSAESGMAVVRWPAAEGRTYQLQSQEAGGDTWEDELPVLDGLPGEMAVTLAPERVAGRSLRVNIRQLGGRPEPEPASVLLALDSDGDGQGDYAEFVARTDPHDAGSMPVVTVEVGGAVVRARVSTELGKRYQLERMAAAGWQPLGELFSGTGGEIEQVVPGESGVGTRVLLRFTVVDPDTDGDGASDWEERRAGSDPHRASSADAGLTDLEWIASLASGAAVRVAQAAGVADVTRGRPGLVRILREGNPAALAVGLAISGDAVAGVDYEALPPTVDFPAGVMEMEIPIRPLASSGAAPSRSLLVGLVPSSDYSLEDSVVAEARIVKEEPGTALLVTDFGATGDGVTDDTAAVNAALHALSTAGQPYDRLHFPPGRYRLNTTTPQNQAWTSSRRILQLVGSGLDGRDLLITGDEGAVLYSTVSPVRAQLLLVEARFRSLRFEGLTFEKDSVPLAAAAGAEPNGADAVSVVMRDGRWVDSLAFEHCRFINCHGAVFFYGRGYDIRGRLQRFDVSDCEILNPYGSNTENSLSAFGGGQQFYLSHWVGRATYRRNLFDGGGEDMTDSATSPGGRVKDGGHFGSPMELVFEDNRVLRMGVEALYQTSDTTLMGVTSSAFLMPPADGSSKVAVTMSDWLSSYSVGDVINIRSALIPGQEARNNLCRIESADNETRQYELSNYGDAGNVPAGTEIGANKLVYRDTEFEASRAVIRRNLFDGAMPPGGRAFNSQSGIVTNARAQISSNLLLNHGWSILLSREAHTPLHPGNWGVVVEANVVSTRDPRQSGGKTFGIEAWGLEASYIDNFILSPYPLRYVGIAMHGRSSIARGNYLSISEIHPNGYTSTNRATGIGAGNESYRIGMIGNYTRGFDIGVGGVSVNQNIPHLVEDHHSLDDELGVDPLGAVSDWGGDE